MISHSPYRICVVCTGNICRSPIGEVVLRSMLDEAGLGDRVQIDSAGTNDWHVGGRADHRTVAALKNAGYDGSAHRARVFEADWVADRDLILVADRGHLHAVRRLVRMGDGDDSHVRLLREFDPEAVAAGTLDVDDPYYGGTMEFRVCLEEIEAACRGVVDYVRAELD